MYIMQPKVQPEQIFSALKIVPIQPFHACDGGIEKITCNVTILVEDSETIPLPRVDDPKLVSEVCSMLLKYGTKRAVSAPVCVQNANTIGILTHHSQMLRSTLIDNLGDQNSIRLVEDSNDASVKHFILQKLPSTARKVSLKHVDFPSHYRSVADTNNWVWEAKRDDNYGNMVWRYASSMMLNPATTWVDPSDRLALVNLTDGPVDALIVATANTLHLTDEPILQDLIEAMTDRVKRRDVPTIVVGIGIQFEFDNNDKNYELNRTDLALYHDFQKEFLLEISKRQKTPAIGVRGDLTKAVCENSGISNCVSMGCPSLTISRDLNLGKTLETNWLAVEKKLHANEKIKIAMTVPAFANSEAVTTAFGVIAAIVERYGSQVTVITQAKTDSERLSQFIDRRWKKMSPITGLKSSMVQYEEYYNVESWLVGARKYDLCLSFRIHGSMTFIGSGVPTVAVPTDFRIMELLYAMKISYMLPEQLQTLLNRAMKSGAQNNDFVLSVMDGVENRDFQAFEDNRRMKLKAWKSILEEIGLEMDPALTKIISSPL